MDDGRQIVEIVRDAAVSWPIASSFCEWRSASSLRARSTVRSRRILKKPMTGPSSARSGTISPAAQNREPFLCRWKRSSSARPPASVCDISSSGAPAARSSGVQIIGRAFEREDPAFVRVADDHRVDLAHVDRVEQFLGFGKARFAFAHPVQTRAIHRQARVLVPVHVERASSDRSPMIRRSGADDSFNSVGAAIT